MESRITTELILVPHLSAVRRDVFNYVECFQPKAPK